MFVSDNLDVNKAGNLTIGGVDTVALAKKYGTPLYVMDEDMIRRDCKIFQKSIDTYYDGQGMVCYASKLFPAKKSIVSCSRKIWESTLFPEVNCTPLYRQDLM